MNPLAQLIGQDRAVELLNAAIAHDRIAPAYLFAGPPGVGRSLAARCFIQLLLGAGLSAEDWLSMEKRVMAGNYADVFWVQPTYLHQGKRLTAMEAAEAGLKRKAPPEIRIDQIREIAQFLSRPPLEGKRAVVAIEDAQTMAEAAANALLKTLEEPGQATIILMAPETDSLLPTLVSRCQRIPFYRLSQEDMRRVLLERGYGEIFEHPELLAIAQGSPGGAIASWTQLKAIPETLLQKLKKPPDSPLNALLLAKEVEGALDIPAQLWLIDYLQYFYWQHWQQKSLIEPLEKGRPLLLSYVQPRLVWECTLLRLHQALKLPSLP